VKTVTEEFQNATRLLIQHEIDVITDSDWFEELVQRLAAEHLDNVLLERMEKNKSND
tara:strand:- start:7660 stop:7830 length:171 start_codon:yes stop_codon:yes gene_type:complete